MREDSPSDSVLKHRDNFHMRHAGQKIFTEEMTEELFQLYNGIDSEAERAMINLFGLPRYSVSSSPDTVFLGRNINGESARKWMTENYPDSRPFIFSHLGQIVDPWWPEITENRLLNVHSAVLPYARGIYSIENIAAMKDAELFRKSAGITIHFIDQGVDTGPIVRTERIVDPFRFNSIWELKGYAYMTGYRLYSEIAEHIIFNQETIPVGTAGDPRLRGTNFRASSMTEEQKRRAEEGYLAMKN